MALTAKEKQKAYRIRQKTKKQIRVNREINKIKRQDMSPRQIQIADDTHMQACLAGRVDVVDKVYASYGPDGTTIVGPSFGPIHVRGKGALKAYNMARGL